MWHRTSRSWRGVLQAAAALLLFGCHSWHPAEPSPAEYIAARHPSSIRLVLTDSSSITLRDTFVRDSSVVGYTPAGLALADSAREITIPVDSIASAGVRKFSWGKTLGLYAAITLPFALIFAASGGVMGD